MNNREISNALEKAQEQGKEVIRWYRKENDFVDFELIDKFLATDQTVEFEGYELLSKEEMWDTLQRWQSKGLSLVEANGEDTIEWQYPDKNGQKHIYQCPYNAHNLMVIFDKLTQGDTIE